jgi:glycosyltransferase involved in cell wall biosynthesis
MRVAMFMTKKLPFGNEWAKAAAVHNEVIKIAIVRSRIDEPTHADHDGDTYVVSVLEESPRWPLDPARRRTNRAKVEACLRQIAADRGPIDLLHGHFYTAGRRLMDLRDRLHIPYVLTEHSTRLTQESAAHKPLSRKGLENARRAYQEAERVIAVSEYLALCIRRLGLPGTIEVIGNPVDVSLFHPVSVVSPSPDVRVVSVGRLEEDKDPFFLLKAFGIAHERDPRLHLEFIGDGPDRAALEIAVREAGLACSVAVLGTLGREEVAAHVRQAHVFALGSRVETFCIAAAEAVAAGVPVVMPRIGPLPELVDDARGILVAPRDPVMFADALLQATQHPGRFDKHGVAAAITARFSYEAVGAKLRDVYDSIRLIA